MGNDQTWWEKLSEAEWEKPRNLELDRRGAVNNGSNLFARLSEIPGGEVAPRNCLGTTKIVSEIQKDC